jgi:hypothetical protein
MTGRQSKAKRIINQERHEEKVQQRMHFTEGMPREVPRKSNVVKEGNIRKGGGAANTSVLQNDSKKLSLTEVYK